VNLPTQVLQIVATPLGNLADVSQRSRDALESARVIACEDTRRTASLLSLLGIDRPKLMVVNDHTEREAVARVVALLEAGERVVLVSDAGTPAISDPGWLVVKGVLDAGLEVDVLPGPTALITALVASGLPTARFCFEGFLPRKGAERAVRLRGLGSEKRTMVLYEAPHRLIKTLDDLLAVCGPDRPVAVCRELTKKFQEVHRSSLALALEWAQSPRKGEMVIVLGGAPDIEATQLEMQSAVEAGMIRGLSRRDAVLEVAEMFGKGRREVYELSLQLEPEPDNAIDV
jgi:16S rRNA (cytidine1402-2'-O)-methyltransferase